MPVRRLLIALLVLGGVSLGVHTQFSSAAYTSATNTESTVTAAYDWTPPTVSITSPGATITGTTTVSATAADSRSAVASVVIQYSLANAGSWTTICTDTVSPYSCSWNTTAVTDGDYQLRARATDTAGISTTSGLAATHVVNSVTVTMSHPDGDVRGTVPLSASVVGVGGSFIDSLKIQYLNASATWVDIPGCAAYFSANLSCSWVTPSGAASYDVRAVAKVGSTTTYSDVVSYSVDNIAPTSVLTVPTGTLSGTVNLTAVAGDEDSGVHDVLFERRLVGVSTWTACGTDDTAPYVCQLNTAALANGTYEFRATATDNAGNATASTIVTRSVDNSAATTSITSPAAGATVRGSVTVTADANTAQGVASVRIESRPSGGTFTTVCSDAVAPYSCTWDTSATLAGSFELRSVLTEGNGNTVTSATVTVTVDNAVLRAQDVQATNVGTSGLPNAGDLITLTYSGVVDLSTIKAGWTGGSTAVTTNLRDKNTPGAPVSDFDRLEFAGANLGQVAFAQNYVNSRKETSFSSTMTATTTTVGGVQVTVVTITLGTPNAASVRIATTTGTMQWTPSALAKTTGGLACSTATGPESGTIDKDL